VTRTRTSAHDLIHGYLPGGAGASINGVAGGKPDSNQHERLKNCGGPSLRRPRAGRWSTSMRWGVPHGQTYGNNIRQGRVRRRHQGMRFDFPGFCGPPTSGRCSCEGKGPFRWGLHCRAIPGGPSARNRWQRSRRLFPPPTAHGPPLARHGRRGASRFQGLAFAAFCWALRWAERHLLQGPRRFNGHGAKAASFESRRS